MTYRTKLPYLFVPATLALATPSFSQDATECASDSDCEEGYECEKSVYSNGCNPDAGPCDDRVYEEEFGSCEKAPVECDSDEDCGEYLACAQSDSGVCWGSSDGSSGCTEPDPDAPKYCEPYFSECETSDECPRSFVCMTGESCPAIDCAEGEDCDLPACEPIGGECVPEQIECDADADCPSDWSCFVQTDYACSGDGDPDGGDDDDGGSSVGGSTGDAALPPDEVSDPLPDPVEIPEEPTCVETRTVGMCLPNAWDGFTDGSAEPGTVTGDDNGSLESGGERESDGEASDDESQADAGGCSVSLGGSSSPSPMGMLFLLGAPLVMFRRRLMSRN